MQIIKDVLLSLFPYRKSYKSFLRSNIIPRSYWEYLKFKVGITKVYWPKDKTCIVSNSRKIFVGINSWVGRPGVYIQGAGSVYIGDYVMFAPNVGILSSNHDLYERNKSLSSSIRIGDHCWIGMNSVLLPGVELGYGTIVGAGSVVTKSFTDGYCVIAGNPARIIKHLEKDKFKPVVNDVEFYGFIPKTEFLSKKYKYLDL